MIKIDGDWYHVDVKWDDPVYDRVGRVRHEFVRIHPFIDGNGRTSRLLMNYRSMIQGFLPVSVDKENRLDYYNALEQYSVNGDLKPFADFVAELEEKQLDEYLKLITEMEYAD